MSSVTARSAKSRSTGFEVSSYASSLVVSLSTCGGGETECAVVEQEAHFLLYERLELCDGAAREERADGVPTSLRLHGVYAAEARPIRKGTVKGGVLEERSPSSVYLMVHARVAEV